MGDKKTRVVVLYGGKSTEHEVACRSAAFVLRNLNPDKYDIQVIAINKSGRWLPQELSKITEGDPKVIPILPSPAGLFPGSMPALYDDLDPGAHLVAITNGNSVSTSDMETVVFPVLHGTFGEDGTMQGLFEVANIAYVGPNVLGSAIGMDKVVAKRLVAAAGVPIVPYIEARAQLWNRDRANICKRALSELGLPLFVKPASLGSSVGVSKVRNASELEGACDEALRFDERVLIEKALDVREIECACLGDYEPRVSIPGEVVPHADFYSYSAKYVDANGSACIIPADLSMEKAKEAQDLARRIFIALELYGMTRVDLFLERGTDKFYFNEVNTIPGLTDVSQYPMLWAASGVPAEELLDTLIELAKKRKSLRDNLATTVF